MSRANYHECHITIEPVLGDIRHAVLRRLAAEESFKVADLIMLKTEEKNPKDSFMTGRDVDWNNLYERMNRLCRQLIRHGFVLRRYKIEKTLLDSKHYDICRLLSQETEDDTIKTTDHSGPVTDIDCARF